MTHAKVKGREVRRIKEVHEIVDINLETGKPITNKLFEWSPADDTFTFGTDKSYVLDQIIKRKGVSESSIWAELQRRANVIRWMKNNNTRYYKDVAKVIKMYYKNPDQLLAKIKL